MRFIRDGYGTVSEAAYSESWFVNECYAGPKTFDYPSEWDAFPGHYRSHNPWFSNYRIVLRKGGLRLVYPSGHEVPLMPLPNGSFREGDDERSPECYRFEAIVDGTALRMLHSGETFYRFFTP